MAPLAMDWLPWLGVACALFVVGLALVVLSPWQPHQDALDREVEARLLLGEDPDEIDRDLAQRAPEAAPATDAPGNDEPAG